jgi:uncharacterized damage-inducible protein DinB
MKVQRARRAKSLAISRIDADTIAERSLPMNALLRDLYHHQVWADAEHWRVAGAAPAAREDRAILARLHHIAIVQRALYWAVGDRRDTFAFTTAEEFTFDTLKEYARQHHDRLMLYISTVTDDRLAAPIDIPWFTDPPLMLKVEEALAQCAMHSQYHRGQNATRLRELGFEPPGTDLITWYWKGRPGPVF